MILHRYIARKFLWMFIGLMTVFGLMTTLIDFIEKMRQLDRNTVQLPDVIELVMLNAPTMINDILPLVALLASIALFLGLARTSELVVLRAAGRSALRSLIAPVAAIFVIGVLIVTMFNPIVAATTKRYAELSEIYASGGANVLSISGEGLWLRQGGHEGQTVIRASSANPDATTLYDVSFIAYAQDGGPIRRIEAQSARLANGSWILNQARVWPLTAGLNPQGNMAVHEELVVASTLTRDRIRDSLGTPASISIWDLPTFIKQLEDAGFSSRRHNVWMQKELARPIFLTAMVLIAAAFTMRHARSGGTGIAVLTAVLLGFGLYYIRNFAQILGETGQIPVLIAAWATPVAANLLALGVLLHMEDG